jgi:hypothetical protein
MKKQHYRRALCLTRKLKYYIIRSLILSHKLNRFRRKTNLWIRNLRTLRSVLISYQKTYSHTIYLIAADKERVSLLWIHSNQTIKMVSKLLTRLRQMKTSKTFSHYPHFNQASMWICSIPTLTFNPRYSLIISDYSRNTMKFWTLLLMLTSLSIKIQLPSPKRGITLSKMFRAANILKKRQLLMMRISSNCFKTLRRRF